MTMPPGDCSDRELRDWYADYLRKKRSKNGVDANAVSWGWTRFGPIRHMVWIDPRDKMPPAPQWELVELAD